MILDYNQIKYIILENPNRDIISKGVLYNKIMRLHLYGEGLTDNLTQIIGYEGEDLYKLRAKYARSNKDLFSRLGRPIDKVFSARGGSVYTHLSEDKDTYVKALKARKGKSVRKWIETIWKDHMLDDPFGMIFLEVYNGEEKKRAFYNDESIVYPTYKAITSVYDYAPNGAALDYVVFDVSKQEKIKAGIDEKKTIYRVVDDAFDYYVEKDGENVTILQAHTYVNELGSVPALLNSDIVSPENEDYSLSFYHDVLELAHHFLLKGSIKLTHEFLHGYPKYWEYADGCSDCGGSKYLNGEVCTSCKGTGYKLMSKVSDAKKLPYPDKDNNITVTPDVAGYVSPDKTYYEIATNDLQLLEELMNVTLWGAQAKVQTQGMATGQQGDTKTATEVMNDIKPQADRLNLISEMAEKRHKFILDAVVKVNLSLPFYPGASVNYGRRYMIEGPDEIWLKYADARIKGAAISVLDDLLVEYYEAKFFSDPIKLAIQTKLMKVEPFVHLTADKVDLMQSVTAEDKAAKVYFGEWLSSINEAMVLSMSPELLRENLIAYATLKAQAVQQAADREHEKQLALKQPKIAA
jgi:hypothetical protein